MESVITTGVRTLAPALLYKMDSYWRDANYLSVGQIYLYDNALLKETLALEHIKPRLLGHYHKACIENHGEDVPEIKNWKWNPIPSV